MSDSTYQPNFTVEHAPTVCYPTINPCPLVTSSASANIYNGTETVVSLGASVAGNCSNSGSTGDLTNGVKYSDGCSSLAAYSTYTIRLNAPASINYYEVSSSRKLSPNSYRSPVTWTLQGSIDGSNYYNIDYQSYIGYMDPGSTFRQSIPTSTYRYFRFLNVSNNYSSYKMYISELSLIYKTPTFRK